MAKYKSVSAYKGVQVRESDIRRYNGRMDICFYIRYKIDGKLKREKIGWRSEGYNAKIAEEIRSKRVRDASHGKEVKTAAEVIKERKKHNRPLAELKELYFNSEHGKAMKGRSIDLNRWENHLKFLENKLVTELTMLDIEKIKRQARKKNLSPQSRKHILTLLKRVINFGVEYKHCPPLAFKIKMPTVDSEKTEYLTDEQVQRLLSVLEKWPNQDISRMIKLVMFTGMRKGEIFKLHISHVDFHQNIITIQNPKGGHSESIPMNSVAREILKTQIQWTNEHHPESLYVFPGRRGRQRVECTAVKRIKKAANLPKTFRPFHGLRHHFAVTLASSGEYTLDMIGELLTHKDTKITRRYAKFLPEAKQKAADRAAELLAMGSAAKVVGMNMSKTDR